MHKKIKLFSVYLYLTAVVLPIKIPTNNHNINILPNDSLATSCMDKSYEKYRSKPSDRLLDNNLINYFYKLYNFSPKNSYGSCGYVSLIQYLSYFDTFYNDSIIPENYERNQGSVSTLEKARNISPGVLRQDYPKNSLDLFNFINDNIEIDYQMKLMSIVNKCNNTIPNNYSYQIKMDKYYHILNNIPVLKNANFNFVTYEQLSLFPTPIKPSVINYFNKYVKERLDKNVPIILHIIKHNKDDNTYYGYHSVVAYYYDEKGIHANFGWESSDNDVILSKDYYITEAGYIDFDNISETHSNNYIVNNIGYCGCGKHIHHNYEYFSPYNNDKHKYFCNCGEYTLRPHAIKSGSTYIENGHHYAKCIDCNDIINLDTTFVFVRNLKKIKVSCNGSYVYENGLHVIVEKDIEDYLNKKLVFKNLRT